MRSTDPETHVGLAASPALKVIILSDKPKVSIVHLKKSNRALTVLLLKLQWVLYTVSIQAGVKRALQVVAEKRAVIPSFKLDYG